MKTQLIYKLVALLLAFGLVAAACGDDDDTSQAGDSTADAGDGAASDEGGGDDADASDDDAAADDDATAGDDSTDADDGTTSDDDGSDDAAAECGTISVAMNDAPQNAAVSYAIDQGIISSDTVTVEVSGLPVPALIEEAQSFANFDVVEAAVNGIAFGVTNGAPLVILGPGQVGAGTSGEAGALQIFVQADSDIESLADLDGGSIGTVALGATTTQIVAIVLNSGHGINPAFEGGDVTWRELPFDQMGLAVANGDVDLAANAHLASFLGLQDPALKIIGVADHEYREISGGSAPALTLLATIQPKVAGREACFDAARQLIAESMDYAQANVDEVAAAVAADFEGADPAIVEPFLVTWLTEWFDYVAAPSDADVAAIQTQIDLGAEAGVNPPIDVASVMLAG